MFDARAWFGYRGRRRQVDTGFSNSTNDTQHKKLGLSPLKTPGCVFAQAGKRPPDVKIFSGNVAIVKE